MWSTVLTCTSSRLTPARHPTPPSITEPPFNVSWACKTSVLLRLVPAAPRPIGQVCGPANVSATGRMKGHASEWACGQVSAPSRRKCGRMKGWAGEPTEQIGEQANEWVGVHCVRSCVAWVRGFFLMLVAFVQVSQHAGDRANTCSVRTLRDGRSLMTCKRVAWPLSSMIRA